MSQSSQFEGPPAGTRDREVALAPSSALLALTLLSFVIPARNQGGCIPKSKRSRPRDLATYLT